MLAFARTAIRVPARRTFAASSTASIHTLPNLPYAYDALEPHISKEIMTLHHTKHHQTYVNGLNAAEESFAKAPSPKERISLLSAIKFNGGGHINHSLFWKNLAPTGSPDTKLQDGVFKSAIETDFETVDGMIKEFNAQTAAIQGSGWGWLYEETRDRNYCKSGSATLYASVISSPTQVAKLFVVAHIPIIGIDIWEHAFYLQYKNVKPDYLKAIWNVINFNEAASRYQQARST
ncbi:Manganese superoxide dismutase [Ceratobasidium theobromae]|uniref:Superoxide dismutase n=1 Tax=Ceratobasidium theobromae TaxID=1582974 RepID=A0A5N5QQA2_9AGAM|nr:Manganese superoxide dismutase [Ceratobasidium theobromae]